MSDLTLQAVDLLGDFLTNDIYELSFTQLYSGCKLSSDQINLLAKSIEIPDTPVNYMEVTHRTFKKSQPVTRTNYQKVSFNMVELSTPQTLPFLRDWANQCAMKGSNYVNPPAARQCQIIVYHKNNAGQSVYNYKLVNCQYEGKGGIGLEDGNPVNPIVPKIDMNCLIVYEGPTIADLL